MRSRHLAILLIPVLAGCGGLFNTGKDTAEPPAELVRFDSALDVRRVWSQDIGGVDEFQRFGLIAATDGGHIYVADPDGEVSAFDVEEGRRRWRHDTDLPLTAGPAVGEGVVVVSTTDGVVVALDATDGSELWRTDTITELQSAAAVASARVVFRTLDGQMLALDISDGHQVWTHEQEIPGLTLRGTPSPVVSGGVAFAGFDNGRVMAVQAVDGSIVWDAEVASPTGTSQIERMVDIDAPVKLVGDDLYVVSYQGRIGMLASESGQPLWSRDMSSFAGLEADWSSVYVTDEHSIVHALDRLTGAPQWSDDRLRARTVTAPVPFGDVVVVGDFAGYLHWFSALDGTMLARVRAGSGQVARPIVIGDLLITFTRDGSLAAFRIDRG